MRNLILIGMPFCGKSTIGKALSDRIAYKYLDTDSAIEEKMKSTVADIFSDKGEMFFRERERELLESIRNIYHNVISTGGGMPIFFENMEILKSIGITIFIDTPLATIVKRAEGKTDRPLTLKNSKLQLEKLYNQRIDIYKKADLIIKAYDCPVNEMVDKILHEVTSF